RRTCSRRTGRCRAREMRASRGTPRCWPSHLLLGVLLPEHRDGPDELVLVREQWEGRDGDTPLDAVAGEDGERPVGGLVRKDGDAEWEVLQRDQVAVVVARFEQLGPF